MGDKGEGEGEQRKHILERGRRDWVGDREESEEEEEEEEEGGGRSGGEESECPALNAAARIEFRAAPPHNRASTGQGTADADLDTWAVLTNAIATATTDEKVLGEATREDGLLVMEALETYTPEPISSDEEEGEEGTDGGEGERKSS